MSIRLKKIIASIAAFAIVATALGLAPVFRDMSVSVMAEETDPQETDPQETDPQETDPQETDPQETPAPGSSETQASGSSETQAPASSGTTAPEETTTTPAETTTTTAATEATTTTTAAPAPIVYVPSGSGNTDSSDAAAEQIVESPKDVASAKTPEITVNASDNGVSADVVAAFTKNKAATTLNVKCTSTLKVAVAKEDISDAAAAKLDFSVSGKNFLNTETLESNEALNNAAKIVQLDFVNTGKLEGVDKATIKSNVGTSFIGQTVTIYEYVDGKLVKIGTAKVNGAGIVRFNTNRLGQFVLAVE